MVIDRSNEPLYKRFLKYEKKGVPIRIEVGSRETTSKRATVVRRDNFEKLSVPVSQLSAQVSKILADIRSSLESRIKREFLKKIIVCDSQENMLEIINSGGVGKIFLCKEKKCVLDIEKRIGRGEVIGFDLSIKQKGECLKCNRRTWSTAYYSRRV